MEYFLRDSRNALRTVVRTPFFSLIVILILTSGIAVNSAIYSIVQHVLFNPLRCDSPHQLMLIEKALLTMEGTRLSMDDAHLSSSMLDWGSLLQSFDILAAYGTGDGGLNLSNTEGNQEPVRIEGTGVSASFFNTFQVRAVLGRTFISEKGEADDNYLTVISHSLWQKFFGADSRVIGKRIYLNKASFTIIGVAPPGFRFPRNTDLWVPISFGKDRVFTGGSQYEVIGRLKEGVSVDQARAEIKTIRQRFQRDNIDSWIARRDLNVIPLTEKVVGNVRMSLLLLWGAVGCVQLIVCVNVASLMLARGLQRRKEFAIHAALGASRTMIFRRLLVESIALSLLAGMIGIIGAYLFLKFIVAYTPASVAYLSDVSLNRNVIGFTVGVSFLTGIVVGVVPGFQAVRIDIDRTLKEGWRLSSESTKFSKVRGMLVVIEVALALTLLIGSGLLIRSFTHVMEIESGVNASNVLTVSISLPKAAYPNSVRAKQFFSELISRIREYPSVRYVGATNILPFGKGDTIAFLFEIVGQPKAGKFEEMFANDRVVTPDYFSSLGIPLIEGRYFTAQDEEDTKQVVIITQSIAKRFWPNDTPIGKQLQVGIKNTPVEIVGIVGDVKHLGLERDKMHEMYFPYQQSSTRLTTLVIKTDSDPLKYATAVRKEVQALDPALPVYDIKTMEQRIDESTGHRRFITFLLGIFAVIAVLLASIGIHSVVAYSVSQRTSEIGIRMALGARRRQILTLIIGKTMILISLGAIAGIVAAIMLTKVMTGMLYGLKSTDFPTYVVTTIGMLAIALVATFFPAYKATRVDPLVALRCE